MEQQEMFPELDAKNVEHKKLLKLAKAFAKAKAERDEILSTAKEKSDSAMQALLDQMHRCDLRAFKFDGVRTEIIQSKEKAQVRLEGDEDEGKKSKEKAQDEDEGKDDGE